MIEFDPAKYDWLNCYECKGKGKIRGGFTCGPCAGNGIRIVGFAAVNPQIKPKKWFSEQKQQLYMDLE